MMTGFLLGVIHLAGSPESVSHAREYVKAKLGERHPALDDVVLLVSELVTNAVVHSDSKNDGTVTLALADHQELVHVDVVDAGAETAPHVGGDVLAEGGRGLMLVDLIAHRWNVHEDGHGRTVWFEVKYRPGGEHGPGDAPPIPWQREP
jgi:anti-sigma regulatory factor (Ser/Thr protein kinase)